MKYLLPCAVLLLAACAGESESSEVLDVRRQALESPALSAAAAPLEAQSADVKSRYANAVTQAQQLARQHAQESYDDLVSERAKVAKTAKGNSEALQNLDRAIELARAHRQRVDGWRGNAPPKRSQFADAGVATR